MAIEGTGVTYATGSTAATQTFDTGTQRVTVAVSGYDITPNDASYTVGWGTDLRLTAGGGGTNGNGGIAKVTYTFTNDAGAPDPVTNVTFTLKDIDSGSWTDVMRIVAYDSNGNILPDSAITTSLGSNVTRSDSGDGVTLRSLGGSTALADAAGQATITISGEVARYEIYYSNTGTGSNSVYSTFPTFETVTQPCFARGTLILTDRGDVAIEDLAEGDLVVTRDNGLQPIRWIGASVQPLTAASRLRPIRIRAGALGRGLPTTDLLVSPQHRVLVRSYIAQKMFGAPEVLVAAKQLCQIDGIDIADDMDSVEYFHMLFDRHEVVISNGAETESLFTGPEALKAVGPAAAEEIFAIFPELRDRDYTPVAARPLASGRMGRKLAVRHAQNGKMLVM